MARPRTVELDIPIEDRIEEAFWELLETSSPERISVVALSKQAHCNRGTFYYYFTDIYDLLDRVIDKNIPTSLAPVYLGYLGGQVSIAMLKQAMDAESERLTRLGILLMKSDSSYCSDRLKDHSISLWCTLLGGDRDSLDKCDYLMFEFVAGGIMGMLAHCGKHHEPLTADDVLDALLPEIPQALIARAKRRHKLGE